MLMDIAIKINTNVDRAIALRNKMFVRSMLFLALVFTCMLYASENGSSIAIYVLVAFSLCMSIIHGLIAGIIIYVELLIVSKIDAVNVAGKFAGAAFSHAKGIAIEKARSIK
jgi:hypothetical protein